MPGLFFDENAARRAVVAALREWTEVEVATSHLREGASDEEQLEKATELGLVLYTFDKDDFPRIYSEWSTTRRPHAGIIVNPSRRLSVGEEIRALRALVPFIDAGDLPNSLTYLTNWL